jgi:hypothetical protein
LNNFPKQDSNNKLKAKNNPNKKVALIQDLNISLQTKVQEDLNRIELWCKDNNMFINCNKTKCMTDVQMNSTKKM